MNLHNRSQIVDSDSLDELIKRVKTLENRLDNIEEFELEQVDEIDSEFYKAELGQVELIGDDGKALKVRTKTFFARDLWRLNNVMHTIETKLVLYDNGLYESFCDMKDESGHRKVGNYVEFQLKSDNGSILEVLGRWNGNFSPKERKPYPTDGYSVVVRNTFNEISVSGKVRPNRFWRAWKR